MEFLRAKGTEKHPPAKASEAVEGYLAHQKRYDHANHILGDRNSFSRTDHGATCLRIKGDHMKNGQLKPGCNAALGVDAECTVAAMISPERSNVVTFIPMMKKLRLLGYNKPVGDTEFESKYQEAPKNGCFLVFWDKGAPRRIHGETFCDTPSDARKPRRSSTYTRPWFKDSSSVHATSAL